METFEICTLLRLRVAQKSFAMAFFTLPFRVTQKALRKLFLFAFHITQKALLLLLMFFYSLFLPVFLGGLSNFFINLYQRRL